MRTSTLCRLATLLLCVSAWTLCAQDAQNAQDASPAKPKKHNTILVIGDGMGFGTLYAAADFVTGSPKGFPFQKWLTLGCTTYSLNNPNGYEPEKMWKDFDYQFHGSTDSAASSSALHTGVKFKNNNVNKQNDGTIVETIAETAKKAGYACGSVTTAGPSHATPAGTAGHTRNRSNGQKIFHQMFNDGALDVIIGISNPNYDAQGNKLPEPKFHQFGPNEEDWAKIQSGDIGDWKYSDDRAELKRIISGEVPAPKKLLFLARAGVTYNFLKHGEFSGEQVIVPQSEEVPTLPELTQAALKVLEQNEKGFYLMVEESTVDGYNHNNNLEGVVNSIFSLNETVKAICEWVEKNSSWDETTVIVTADHSTGGFWGEQADQPDTLFQLPTWNGKGKLATGKYYTHGHTNAPPALYINGEGAKIVDKYIKGTDKKLGEVWGFDGRYIDDTDVPKIEKEVMGL